MKFAATKISDQLDLQALHRVRERLVSQRTGVINQIRAFPFERWFAIDCLAPPAHLGSRQIVRSLA
jgi:hypothetical protein